MITQKTQIFSFDPAEYVDEYKTKGWIHIKGGIDPDFHAVLRESVAESLSDRRVEGRAIYGQKEQAIFEFPPSVAFPEELFDVVAATCGLHRPRMTLSERHFKSYDEHADPDPPAHKERYASVVSMGLSIDIPRKSRLILYPFDDVSVNPFNVSSDFRNSLDPDEPPEVILENAREVEIDDSGGDVIMFRGSAFWHKRRNAAGAVNLYLKYNDFDSDPLGEDPQTEPRRARTVEALRGMDGRLSGMVPVLARRFDGVARQYTRNAWQDVLLADVWGADPFRVSEAELAILRAIDGTRSVETLTAQLARNGERSADVEAALRRLAERGAVDLVEPGS